MDVLRTLILYCRQEKTRRDAADMFRAALIIGSSMAAVKAALDLLR